MTPGEAIDWFLHTGEHDPAFTAWHGAHPEPQHRGESVLRRVLRRVLAHRIERAPLRALPRPNDPAQQIRQRIEPMVREFFAPEWVPTLLDNLPKRLRVITPNNYAAELELVELETAWRLANLLLDDLGMPPLADDTPTLDGLCTGDRAWVTPRAFVKQQAPFTDVIVHEAAHLLHNTTGATMGLPTLSPLLQVPQSQHETFAYACEIWAVIERQAACDHVAQVQAFEASGLPDDWRVDHPQLVRALAAAADGAGWAAIRETTHRH